MKRKALGRGLGLSALVPSEKDQEAGVLALEIGQITPNRYQPRQHFQQEALESLAASLKQLGLIQPIIVRKEAAGRFELIAGERRWRAAKLAGLSKIPALVRDADDQELMEWALLENVQREDLNPIEKARAYERLISQFSLTQESIAQRMGINRSSVANFVRLLHLPSELWDDIAVGRLTMGHAKALLSLEEKRTQLQVAAEIKARHLTVRQVEALARRTKTGASEPPRSSASAPLNADHMAVEARLRQSLGTKVRIIPQGDRSGEIRIAYYSLDDLDRLLDIIA